ncbi:DUF6279 family lipoprotein [Nitrosomonas supralitoralis]|uniref:Lipoprotein n=1 Tax=Nitrosomonas supralitoralis TaxID=2116706 RepID=A0A2P7NZP6_9PROT|nr:DUF6279 family lipoprotein [Nitrosomonas supralitoralis]PSJ18953.1 hypothetical protein C7H79_00515 [Nitrosomonas supralitoralis]
MQSTSRRIALIILFSLLSGCSIVRLSYDHGPQLTWWWLDGYVGFNREQAPHAKQAIHQWFGWHRSTQLPEYVDWLVAVRTQIDGPLTPSQICKWSDELQNIIAPAFDQAAQLSAPVILRLGEAQWRHLEQRYVKSNDELRGDYLQPDLGDRRQASIKRTVKRIENLYGDIDKTQQQLIAVGIESSPFNPEVWIIERQRRQQETLRTLRQLASESTVPDSIIASLRQLIEYTHRSDDPDYRAYQLKLSEYTCDFIARMHNSATPAQRQHAHDKLKGWETDLRALLVDNRMHTALE